MDIPPESISPSSKMDAPKRCYLDASRLNFLAHSPGGNYGTIFPTLETVYCRLSCRNTLIVRLELGGSVFISPFG